MGYTLYNLCVLIKKACQYIGIQNIPYILKSFKINRARVSLPRPRFFILLKWWKMVLCFITKTKIYPIYAFVIEAGVSVNLEPAKI